jgi:hypothetical protein
MQYMLLIMGDEKLMNAATEVDDTGMSADYAYNDALIKAGAIRGGERLRPTSATTTVRVRDKKAVVLDGPTPRPRNSWAASTSSTCPISTTPSNGPRNAPPPSSAPSK